MYEVTLPYDGKQVFYNYKEGSRIIADHAQRAGVLCKGAKQNRRYYYDVIMAFDIETTKLENLNYDPKYCPESLHYFNITFCWQCSVDGLFIFGRKPEEFFEMLDTASTMLDGLIVCFVHNLAYEFNNLRDFFLAGLEKDDDIFMKTRSTPLYLRYRSSFEFRCSKQLTGKSLAKIGSEIGYNKLVGDFDYSVPRDFESNLEPLELNYCFRDVMILDRFLKSERDNFCKAYNKRVVNIAHLPYTVTGYVRLDVKKYFSNTNHGRYILKHTELTLEEYLEISAALWGGYTHANFRYIGEELTDVFHADIVSAYPGAFLTPDGFPYKLTRSRVCTVESFLNNLNTPDRAVIANVTFHGLILKRGGVPYVPALKSKCDPTSIIENGKVLYSAECNITACDVDLKLIMGAYDYESIEIGWYYFGHKQKLPYNIIMLIVKYFAAKTTMKSDPSKIVDYGYAKSKLNSIYGMSCASLLHAVYKFAGGSCVESGFEYEPAKVIPYQWAIYITAYTRRLIYGLICKSAQNGSFAYSDTDSIFFRRDPVLFEAIREHNEKQREYLQELRKWHFDIIPKSPKGVEQYLFTLDYEDCTENETDIKSFCAIGAKRYYIGRGDGVYDVTFSGLRATKSSGGKNGYNVDRLIKQYGSLHKAFLKIKENYVDLPYVEGVDKLSNYNITANFYGILNGREYRRPCSYTLYPQSIRLTLNHDLKAFLQSERRNEFE